MPGLHISPGRLNRITQAFIHSCTNYKCIYTKLMGASHKDQPKKDDDDSTALAQALNLVSAYMIPMALKAAVELDVFEIIGNAGPGAQLSPAEIVSKIPNSSTSTTTARAAVELDRILRYLANNGVLTCSAAAAACESGGRSGVGKRYGLSPVGKFYRKNNEDGISVVSLIQMNQDKVIQDTWQELKYGVVEGVVPFRKAHGMSTLSEYGRAHPRFGRMFNQGMSDYSNMLFKKMLDTYTGFQGIKKLVHVAGGFGTTLRTIVAKFPHIKGINFDLPHVISEAPPISGVEHVGGDIMFDSVPRGDAIFLKSILHNWHDEGCLKLLKKCYKALPASGKVIRMECIVPEVPEAHIETQVITSDLCMMAYFDGGKERTLKEFEFLAKKAEFKTIRVACSAYDGVPVMELLLK